VFCLAIFDEYYAACNLPPGVDHVPVLYQVPESLQAERTTKLNTRGIVASIERALKHDAAKERPFQPLVIVWSPENEGVRDWHYCALVANLSTMEFAVIGEQFTDMCDLMRARLDDLGLPFETLASDSWTDHSPSDQSPSVISWDACAARVCTYVQWWLLSKMAAEMNKKPVDFAPLEPEASEVAINNLMTTWRADRATLAATLLKEVSAPHVDRASILLAPVPPTTFPFPSTSTSPVTPSTNTGIPNA
jgi:hypothetical protein